MDKNTRPEEINQEPMIMIASIGQPPPPDVDVAFRVEFEEARESEDYHGIYRDLDFVISVTRQLRSILLQQSSQPSSVASSVDTSDNTLHSLWLAALIKYGRCFHKGKRRWLDESVFEGQPEDIFIWHRYFKDTRDKHVAHSVNPFDIHATGVHIADYEGDNPRVESMVTVWATRSGESPQVVEYLEWLATYVRDEVWKKHDEASHKVLDRAKLLSTEEIRKLRPLEIIPQQGLDVARVRRSSPEFSVVSSKT